MNEYQARITSQHIDKPKFVAMAGALTALGYSCWEHGIQHGKLAVLAAASYFTPVLSALMASLLLQVLPGWSFWQGVALVTLGSLICWWATRIQ